VVNETQVCEPAERLEQFLLKAIALLQTPIVIDAVEELATIEFNSALQGPYLGRIGASLKLAYIQPNA